MAVVGIDLGTQSVKVVVLSTELERLGSAAECIATAYPRPGWAEHDACDWERALARALPRALAAAGVAATELRAVGVSGQLDGCVAVDARGEPVSPCLIWMDRRAEAELPELDLAAFRRQTGLVADAGHMAAKARWLLRRGDLPDGARFHQPVSYLVERLTGASLMDRGLASTTMLYDLAAGDYDEALLAAFELSRAQLPAISEATAAAGTVSADAARRFGLPAGAVVAVGTGDDFATPLGAGLVAPGPMACVLGTAEVVGAVSERPVIDDAGLLETHGWLGGGAFVENPGWLAGGAVSWLRGLCAFADDATLDAAAAEVEPGADGLLFLPALSGAMAPVWNAAARGCFYGLTAAHDRRHLARAVLEGCAFAMRDVALRLGELGVGASPVVLLGGGARSELWARIRADVADRPVEVAATADHACCTGAALTAVVAAGLWPDLGSAAARVSGRRARFSPDASRAAAYREHHGRYRALFAALEPMFGT